MIDTEHYKLNTDTNGELVSVFLPYPPFWKEINFEQNGKKDVVIQHILDEYDCSVIQWGGDGIHFLKSA